MNRKTNLFEAVRGHVANAVPFGLTFAPCGKMTDKEKLVLEDYLRRQFHIWADSWILPLVDEMEQRYKPKARKK